jgi:hypothetical protein
MLKTFLITTPKAASSPSESPDSYREGCGQQ